MELSTSTTQLTQAVSYVFNDLGGGKLQDFFFLIFGIIIGLIVIKLIFKILHKH